jgi:MFS family permease
LRFSWYFFQLTYYQNWPLWKRDITLVILSLTSIFATCLGPILAANTLTLSLYFELKFTKIAVLTGWYLFGVGIAAILFVPLARIFGKRHLFVLGTILLVISSLHGGAVRHNYMSLAAARFWQGVGTAPFETLVNAAVGDMYFVHVSWEDHSLCPKNLYADSPLGTW